MPAYDIFVIASALVCNLAAALIWQHNKAQSRPNRRCSAFEERATFCSTILQDIISVMALRQSCSYDAPHFFRRDWLLDNGSTEFVESRPCTEPNGVAGNEDQPVRQGRPSVLQPTQQCRTVEIWHPDVT
jgi:hypothetical protein